MVKQKLVRDNIPELIIESGQQAKRHVAKDKEYYEELENKICEEVKEFKESGDISELADILEVVYAIADFKGVSIEELEKIRVEKAEKKGKFEKRIILELDE